jgi:hypothetical protein
MLKIATENGHLLRVNLESRVLNAGPLLNLQDRLAAELPDFSPKPTDELHLTIMHIGQPEMLFEEIGEAGGTTDFAKFLAAFQTLIDGLNRMIPNSFWLETEAMAEFGAPHDPSIVLRFAMPDWLSEVRQRAAVHLNEWLAACGVSDIPGYISGSINFHHQLPENYRPHVSLGRCHSATSLPDFDVTGLRVEFAPSHLRNVSEVMHG